MSQLGVMSTTQSSPKIYPVASASASFRQSFFTPRGSPCRPSPSPKHLRQRPLSSSRTSRSITFRTLGPRRRRSTRSAESTLKSFLKLSLTEFQIGSMKVFFNFHHLGGEPGSSAYWRRLMFQRSWARIPTPYTGWTFFTFICCKNCNVVIKD